MKKLICMTATLVAIALLSGCGIGVYAGIGVSPAHHQRQAVPAPACCDQHQRAPQHGKNVRIQAQERMVPVCNRGGSYDPVRKLCVIKGEAK